MKPDDLKITTTHDGISITGIKDFDPVHTFDSGQCFRWLRQPDGSYIGVAGERSAQVLMTHDGKLVMSGVSEQDFRDFWFEYFDLGRDYAEIKSELAAKDRHMRDAVEFGSGLRLLKQDLWEVLISFIISSNNRIPRIMRSVEALSREFGREIPGAVSEGLFSFPRPHDLADEDEHTINICKGGFRCKYIDKTVKMTLSGDFDTTRVAGMCPSDARSELMRLPGVGPKVADCVLLFSGTCRDVFPTDVWVKRIMEHLYLGKDRKLSEIQDFASGYFGENRGIAQEYLFYYARYNREKLGI